MIVSRAPLRFSLNGGGSDLPSYCEHFVGEVISAPIDKYVYLTFHLNFSSHYRVAYNKVEVCETWRDIQHPIIRAAFEFVYWDGPPLEITSIADVPSTGSGLGSSSAFTVALLQGLYYLQGVKQTPETLARSASDIEINKLKSPIGRQDQYASAFGDLKQFRFHKNEVSVTPILGSTEKRVFFDTLNKHLMFFHINFPRSTNDILAKQSQLISDDNHAVFLTNKLVSLVEETRKAILKNDMQYLGTVISKGWKIKMTLNGDDQNQEIRDLFESLKLLPIYGSKLLGAGGGGFLAVIAPTSKHEEIRDRLGSKYKEFNARIVTSGPKIFDLNGGNA